uniref:Uncharacterized protein n=1 Tax=Arundo donax TaxID=35708 RepID=A0A0A9CA69_ARUDO
MFSEQIDWSEKNSIHKFQLSLLLGLLLACSSSTVNFRKQFGA